MVVPTASTMRFRHSGNMAGGAGDRRVDTALFGEARAATADEVRAASGFAIGGVPPVGHERPLETVIDEDLLGYDVVWAAAGTPNAVFPIKPADLVERCSGRVERVSPGS